MSFPINCPDKVKEDEDCAPVFIDVKKEPEEEEEEKENDDNCEMTQDMEESIEEKFDPLSNIKVEYEADMSNIASTSFAEWTTEIKQEAVLEEEDISIDMEYESQEWSDHDMNSDGNDSSISISDNLDNLKQEETSEESTEESSENDDDDDDDYDYDNDVDDDEGDDGDDGDEEEGSDDDDDNVSADPLRRCLSILKKRPNMVLDIPEIAILLLILIRRRRRNQPKLKKRRWTISDTSDRVARINFQKKFTERRKNHKQFLNDFNMSTKTFDELLEKISHKIKRKDTNMRYAITPAERLAVTLRYLASGFSYTQLLEEFDIGKTTISGIVKTTADIIWQELKKEYMPDQSKEDWLKIADKFKEKTGFPNCLGSISCKYIKVIVPKSKESEFDQHQKYFATAILAIVDSDMNFIDVSVGVLGNSNDNFLAKSVIGQKITKGLYVIPESKPIFGPESPLVPYVFISKDSLNVNIMKPFSKSSNEKKNIFNQRLESVHDISETCLKIVAYKWRVLRRGIGHHTYAETTIKTVCILHNFIMKKEGIVVNENESWILDGLPSCGSRGSASANQVREHYANYFMSPQGEIPSQYLKPQSVADIITETEIHSQIVNGMKVETCSTNLETEIMDGKGGETSNDTLKSDVVIGEEEETSNNSVEADEVDGSRKDALEGKGMETQ